jgi:hypothetical protein
MVSSFHVLPSLRGQRNVHVNLTFESGSFLNVDARRPNRTTNVASSREFDHLVSDHIALDVAEYPQGLRLDLRDDHGPFTNAEVIIQLDTPLDSPVYLNGLLTRQAPMNLDVLTDNARAL